VANVEGIEEGKKERQRSPNYPAVGLREAVERVRKLIQTDGKAGAPPEIAAKHIGYSSAHGQAMSVVAALKKFNLVADSGGRLAPTQSALEIVNLPETDPRRQKALKEAALSPFLYQDLVNQHEGKGFPSPDVLEAELTTYKGFNPKAVGGFVKDFLDSLDFAGIIVGGGVNLEKDEGAKVKTGDWIQWVSQGIEQFRKPKRIAGFTEDGKYAFLDGEKTAAPVNELEVVEAPANGTQPAFVPAALKFTRAQLQPPTGGSEIRQDVFSLDNRGEVTISWPVPLTQEMVTDIKDWLKIVERKITRSIEKPQEQEE
jgi:hypothetical protein